MRTFPTVFTTAPHGPLRPPARTAPARTAATAAAAGFSLVELLVVIGIIAILAALMLTSVSAARRQANMVKCAANLRQITEACMLHAHDHRGYLPLAGMLRSEVTGASGASALPAALNDTERKRYTYAMAPRYALQRITAPLPAAVAPYLGVKNLDFSDWTVLDQQLNDTRGAWQFFMGPSTDAFDRARIGTAPGDTSPAGQAAMMAVDLGGNFWFWWATNTDFGMNEAVFGYDNRTQYAPRRLGGNLARVRRPAEVMLFADALPNPVVDPTLPATFPCAWITFAPTLEGTEPVTLADAHAGNDKVVPYRGQMDRLRHRNRANVVFADGHVENMMITPGDLERVKLTAR